MLSAIRGVLIVALLVGTVASAADSKQPDEKTLRVADERQAEAARTRNADALDAMMHSMFMVNSPEGKVWRREEVLGMWRSRGIGHDSFERTIEQIKLANDVGIVMGREVVAPSSDSVAGQRRRDGAKPVERRFTNIWLWQNNRWWFLARHANEQPDGKAL